MSKRKPQFKNTKTKSKALGRSSYWGLFADRKISTKIATGFATILAITVLISGAAYFEFGTVADQFRTYMRVVHNSAAIDEVDRQFLTLECFVDVGTTSVDRNQVTPAAAINNDLDWKES